LQLESSGGPDWAALGGIIDVLRVGVVARSRLGEREVTG
jgi:hypothetical protein